MSRAYCLTCNEQVHETAGGTCPLGHPVTAHDHGPEPWVGFASPSTSTGFADDDLREGERDGDHADVAMSRLDTEGRPVVHAGAQANGRVNGHANGHVNGHALGGGHGDHDPFPSTFGHRSSFAAEASETTERAPANGQAADDLAALLAEALEGGTAASSPVTSDVPPAPEPPAPSSSEDWGDLASLAAELQLDADGGVDDGPAAQERPVDHAPSVDAAPADAVEAAHGPDAPADNDLDEASIASADIDELLAELTGGAPQAPDPQATREVAPDPMPEAAAPEPPPAPATPPPPPPPPAVPQPDPVAATDSVPPLDDLRSPPPPPVEDAFDLWEHDDLDTGHAEVAPAAEVDLTNFTARGRRVGGSGAPAPRRAPFGRKKKKG